VHPSDVFYNHTYGEVRLKYSIKKGDCGGYLHGVTGSNLTDPTARAIYQIGVLGTAPKAMINIRSETIVAVGAVMAHIPLVDRLDSNPIEIIENGDEVEVDADNGLVIINK
jgi:predicted aconitase with swiveling domain